MPFLFTDKAMGQYDEWDDIDRKTKKRIKLLLKDIQRNGLAHGIGKPEPLRYQKGWSRRIDEKNRLVYTQDANNTIIIVSCKGHYED
ncbi:MAG: Txe/YoeB family addiction module toxin [Oscillospiraceae bacterium]|nr:Txe/YoeB family addiction module toxin [Oscillospiraceae bacterium]